MQAYRTKELAWGMAVADVLLVLVAVIVLTRFSFPEDAKLVLPEAKHKVVFDAYQRAVAAQAEFNKAFTAYNDLVEQIVAEEKWPKGTRLNVVQGACTPIPGKNAMECSYDVSVVPPPPDKPAEKK